MPRWPAAASPSNRPSSARRAEDHQRARPDDQRRGDREAGPRGPGQAAEQEREDLAQVRPRDVHRHRQERRQHGPDGVAGEEQAGEPAGATGAAEAEHDVGRQQRPGERQPVQQPELEDRDLDREEHGDRRAERGPRRRAEHVRIGQRVPEQTLERGAGDGESRADDHRGQDARQAQVPDDRLGRRRPVQPDRSPASATGSPRWSRSGRSGPTRGRRPGRP